LVSSISTLPPRSSPPAIGATVRARLLHFTAANLVSRRFWLGHGFRPIEYWLHHQLDERIVSAEQGG
jgi:hypothetical protein